MDFDPYRVRATSQTAFGSTGPPELLATAQQIAGINRRLVTTESFDLPVVGGTLPNQTVLALGPDGLPGRAGVDDDSDNTTDEPDELNAATSDDFRWLFGKEVAKATIHDLLRYRVWQQVRAGDATSQPAIDRNFIVPNDTCQLCSFSNTSFTVGRITSQRRIGDRRQWKWRDRPANGEHVCPEVVAGVRMDLNRPFGDGTDNNSNGVVDDPLEAGEPFLDVSGNGKCDNGEPWIDLDGDKTYTFPGDKLWLGLTAETIEFDYSNGQALPVYPTGYSSGVTGGVRNLETQARQLYARNLYCMMLLLVDENYIAPWDENDTQVMSWMDTQRTKIEAALTAAGYPAAGVKRKPTF